MTLKAKKILVEGSGTGTWRQAHVDHALSAVVGALTV